MEKNNPRTGSSFDDFLKKQGMYDEVTAKARKRAISDVSKEDSLDADLLTNNPLFGLWQDRGEISDVAAFARQLRAQSIDTFSKKRSANLPKKSRQIHDF